MNSPEKEMKVSPPKVASLPLPKLAPVSVKPDIGGRKSYREIIAEQNAMIKNAKLRPPTLDYSQFSVKGSARATSQVSDREESLFSAQSSIAVEQPALPKVYVDPVMERYR